MATGGRIAGGGGDGDIRMIYVLLDGVGDLPHPDLGGDTPLGAARTPALDKLAANGAQGSVISVGRGIAPESDIAVFNMLGYRFEHKDYVGRGVIEAIGVGMDFRDGDLAMRGNFATLDDRGVITDRRAGRNVGRDDALGVAAEIEGGLEFSHPGTSAAVVPTIGHRVTVRIRSEGGALSFAITNTDPAYGNVGGMGVARTVDGDIRVERCSPTDAGAGDGRADLAARLVNEFSDQTVRMMKSSPINQRRGDESKKRLGCILLRDAGNRYPVVTPIDEMYSIKFSCIVDMPVEVGISKVLKMEAFEAGGLADYEEKARVAAGAMDAHNVMYVHLKGPDEFGHDGDAVGKKENIEEIDRRFFGTLLDEIDTGRVAVVVSADHATPCIKKGHSDDPVPLLVSGDMVAGDGTVRMTEAEAKRGGIGLIDGAQVVRTAIDLIRPQT